MYPLEGYRRLTYMMIDSDIVAVSPSSVFGCGGKLAGCDAGRSDLAKKGTGFEQPLAPHEH